MMNLLVGAVIMALGFYMTIKSNSMLSMFGRIVFFEKYLGTEGGSRLGYTLLGIAVTVIGMMVFTNLFGNFLTWVLSPLIKLSQPLG